MNPQSQNAAEVPSQPASAPPPNGAPKKIGIGMHSYGAHWTAARRETPGVPFTDPLSFLRYAHKIGAAGVQVAIGTRDQAYLKTLRTYAESNGLYLEGQLSLPRASFDVSRFEAELADAKAAGATVVRTALLSGRRYETFRSAEQFREFADRSWESLTLAEPILKRHRIRLAVENHKDWSIPELVGIMRRISSEYVGICVDTGNSIALLEHPEITAREFAPWAASTHLKDMAVEPFEDGFLLSEVPLGKGFLDLRRITAVLLEANPKIQFNLEMITRDPLKIPCLTDPYWATMEAMHASQLAAAWGLVRSKASSVPYYARGRTPEERLKIEDDNVRESIATFKANA